MESITIIHRTRGAQVVGMEPRLGCVASVVLPAARSGLRFTAEPGSLQLVAKLCPPPVASSSWRRSVLGGIQQIPAYAAVQGGAIAMAAATDHFTTPRLGPLSCSPPA